MRSFEEFDAVKFPEENLIFITYSGYIYYIYDPKYDHWKKHKHAWYDHITVENYPSVSREELIKSLGGVFPDRETVLMRHCHPSELWVRDMMDLLDEDYPAYMSSEYEIHYTILLFLQQSTIYHKSYLEVRRVLDNAVLIRQDPEQVLALIKELCFRLLGRDIFKKEIGIMDGHRFSSCFWFRPVRVIDWENTDEIYNVAEMQGVEISIEEDDVAQYLTPFLYKFYDDDLEANQKRVDNYLEDEDENEQCTYKRGFEWNLAHNFFTHDSIREILDAINETIDALTAGKETEYTKQLEIKRGTSTTEIELIIDFYKRFIYRIEYMLKVGEEKGFDLISVMGP